MKNRKGISLIVLVITIVLMIILTAAVIMSLDNSNIINKANEAVNSTNLSQAQTMATLIWAERYLDKLEITEEYIIEKLKEQGIKTEQYTIILRNNGVTVKNKKAVPDDWKNNVREVTEDNVPIPNGFVKSPYKDEGTKDGGLVIYELNEDEIEEKATTIKDEHSVALVERNQFVWVPVEQADFKTKFIRSNNGWKDSSGNDKYTLSSELGTKYWEIVLNDENMVSQDIEEHNLSTYISSKTLSEITKMYRSVEKYGGFYIARYEVGTKSTFNDSKNGYIAERATKDDISNLFVAKQKYPYVAVAWGAAMDDENSTNGAVSLARAFYPDDSTNVYGAVSTLTYGVQWDRILAWWKEKDENINLKSSKDYGVYDDTIIQQSELNTNAEYSKYNSETTKYEAWSSAIPKKESGDWLFTTGAYENANVCNIYDIAGNAAEWTMEGYSKDYHVIRGGSFNYSGESYPVLDRDYYTITSEISCYGFRISLYIKL